VWTEPAEKWRCSPVHCSTRFADVTNLWVLDNCRCRPGSRTTAQRFALNTVDLTVMFGVPAWSCGPKTAQDSRRPIRLDMYRPFLFLTIALASGALGFGMVALGAAGIAKIGFYIFIVLFLVSLLLRVFLVRFDRTTRDPERVFATPPPLGRSAASHSPAASRWLDLSGVSDGVEQAGPGAGDFIVLSDPDGYVVERLRPGNGWKHVSTERHRLSALSIARRLARSAGTRAWCSQLDS
jgi:uncharacterized membrane protein YtjA (UPF0391 family)